MKVLLTPARIAPIASWVVICAGVAYGCAAQIERSTAGSASGAGGAGGAGGASGAGGAGSHAGAGAASTAVSSSGTGIDAGMPAACASDSAGRPLTTHGGGDSYHLAPGERIDVQNDMFSQVSIGDVTGDGRADIVGAELDHALVFAQKTDGSLGAPIKIPHEFSNPPSVALLQANADKTLDLVMTSSMGLEVIPSLGGGAFAAPNFLATVNGFDLQITDLDLDGHDDVVSVSEDGISLAYGDGAGSLGKAGLLPDSFHKIGGIIALGDMTGDTIPDLVGLDYLTSNSIVVIPHDGVAGLSPTGWTTVPMPGGPYAGFDVGDVNGDGLLDVVAQEDDNVSYDVRTRLFPGKAGGFDAPVEIAKASYGGGLVVADVNADGREDVVMVHAAGFAVGVVLATPAGPGPYHPYVVPTAASVAESALAVGDIDCDGCPDVVTADVGGLVVFRGQGCGS